LIGYEEPVEPESCLVWAEEDCTEEANTEHGNNGENVFSNCMVETYTDVCEGNEIHYCWLKFTMNGEQYEGSCDELDEEHENYGCKAEEYGPFKCPEGYGYDQCEYFSYKPCGDEPEKCFVDYVNPTTNEWEAAFCEDLPPLDEEQCEVTCNEAWECPVNDFDSCMMKDCHDSCEGKFSCYAEWYDGE